MFEKEVGMGLDNVLLDAVKRGEETLLTNEQITEFGDGFEIIDALMFSREEQDISRHLRISVNPIGRFGFIRSLFHLLFRPCSFTVSDRIGLVFSSIHQPVQFDDCCAINGRVMHRLQWGY